MMVADEACRRGAWVSLVPVGNLQFRGVRKIARGDVFDFLGRAVTPEDGISVWMSVESRAITALCLRDWPAPNS